MINRKASSWLLPEQQLRARDRIRRWTAAPADVTSKNRGYRTSLGSRVGLTTGRYALATRDLFTLNRPLEEQDPSLIQPYGESIVVTQPIHSFFDEFSFLRFVLHTARFQHYELIFVLTVGPHVNDAPVRKVGRDPIQCAHRRFARN